MKSSNDLKYWLIFDTNALFQTYEKKADFTKFSFNTTFNNVVSMIEQLDIYAQVTVAIPSVVWSEMEKQIIEKHDESLLNFKSTIRKRFFPEYTIKEEKSIDYPEYIKTKIKEYKEEISEDIVKVTEIPIASENRFKSIVKRAFDKLPPFEGKSKRSDKGFKDALLWESILEFATNRSNLKIIYYSKDNVFGDSLLNEFEENVPDSSLSICKDEKEVKTQLEEWSKEIDEYSYQPIEDFDENEEIENWINSEDFLVKIREQDFVEKGRLIVSTEVNLISIDNIDCLDSDDDWMGYCIEVTLQLIYKLKDGVNTQETININMEIELSDDDRYLIKDAYIIDEDES